MRTRAFAFVLGHYRKVPSAAIAATVATAFPLAGLASSSTVSCERKTSSLAMSAPAKDLSSITGYLNAEDSAALDAELMSTPGFSLEQLMELAGLSVAEAVYAVVPPLNDPINGKERKKILLICGPGNNGGDGLVAARHLVLFGYDCTVVYPKQSKKQHFINLVKQMQDVGVEILEEFPADAKQGKYAAIVDAIFGFSFKGDSGIREPFGSIIEYIVESQGSGDGEGSKIISVDVPSGWDVNGGDLTGTGFMPDVLISLTSPKLSAKKFTGRHFVGGRFLPSQIAEKYGVKMPPYKNVAQVMEMTEALLEKATKAETKAKSNGNWEEEYVQYLMEKEQEEHKTKESNSERSKEDKKEIDAEEVEDWAVQYQQYCIEKEKALDEVEKKRKEQVD